MPALEAIQLTKQYGGHTALDGLNLSLQPGDIFCLLGQNGAGKTTTLNIFLGFIAASSGEARILDMPVTMNGVGTRRYLAYIPEVVQLYPNLTGIENLDYFSRLAGFRYTGNRLQELLLMAGLPETAHRKRLQTFSKGMRQKVGIAIALAKDARVIFMDEPTSGLDPRATQEFTAIVQQLGREGRTVLMATHDLFNAVQAGTRIGIMKAGHLIHAVPTSAITADSLQQLYLETI